ncbi:hypothetical protein [Kibdelosporangium banguiense]|uniref:hypothetical protein n=1 Tax=Kibdelosporangium banguiense TaxID=1365924 RepID=UPI001AE9800C|nr:hypothetical protein [Kibdelosporangium banguiense]
MRTGTEQAVGQRRDRADHVLTVVQYQQGPPGLQGRDQLIGRFGAGFLDFERGQYGARYVSGDRREFDQPDTVGLVVEHGSGGFAGETGLAGAAWAGDCREAVFVDQLGDLGDVGFPADEARQAGTEIRAASRCVGFTAQYRCVQRGKFG